MATIVTPSDLTVTISESYSLNGVAYGNTMNKTFTSNGQVSQRIMSIAAYTASADVWTSMLSLDAADGQGEVVSADYKYFRITNLDNANSINVRVFDGTNYIITEVSPLSSLLLMDDKVDVQTAADDAASLSSITAIAAQSSSITEDVDVEFLIVTT